MGQAGLATAAGRWAGLALCTAACRLQLPRFLSYACCAFSSKAKHYKGQRRRGAHLVSRLCRLCTLLRCAEVPLRLCHPLLSNARRATQLGQPRTPRIHVGTRLQVCVCGGGGGGHSSVHSVRG